MSPGAAHEDRPENYGAVPADTLEEPSLNPEDERLFANARALEFGDWNYPVITAHHASKEDRLRRDPRIITTSTNRNILQPTRDQKRRRKSKIKEMQKSADKGKHRRSSSSSEASGTRASNLPIIGRLLHRRDSSSSSAKSDRSQLVDLVVEDVEAEQVEKVRARKEGSPRWNEVEQKHYVQTYPEGDLAEEVREGYEPDTNATPAEAREQHTLDASFAVGEDDEGAESSSSRQKSNEDGQFKRHEYSDKDSGNETNVWDDGSLRKT